VKPINNYTNCAKINDEVTFLSIFLSRLRALRETSSKTGSFN